MNVRELKIKEVRAVLESMEKQGPVHTMDILFPGEIPVLAVALSTDKAIEDLEEIPPSEMRGLIDEVKKANPFFLNAIEAMKKMGLEILSASMPVEKPN